MLRRIAPLLIFTVLAMILVACSSGSDSSESSGSGDSAERNDVIIGLESDANTLLANTDNNWITEVQIRNIYDPLIFRDENGQPNVPALATEWEEVDELTWEFTLREGVEFHNGEPFNAEAVKYNFDYLLNEENNSSYRSRWMNVDEVVVLDEYKVQIKLKEPFPDLMNTLATDILIMEPKHLEEVGLEEAAKNPVGTGAYKFVEWARDQYLKLEANENYWQGTPAIKEVTFKYIPEFSSRFTALLSRDIDLMKGVPVDSVNSIETTDGVKSDSISTSRVFFLTLNTHHEGPLQDKKVRQAINYAVNVDEILANILDGYGEKMTGPLSKINADYTETEDYGYDPDKAIQLIEEAGYKPEDIELTLETPEGRYPMDSHVAQAIAAQIEQIGVKVKVQVNEWGNHLSRIEQREVQDMFILGWGNAWDAQSTIEDLFTKDAPYSGFYDPEIEEMIKDAVKLYDRDERKAAFDELQHRLVEEAAWVPLWQQHDIYGINEGLNFTPSMDEEIQVYNMSW